MITKNELLKGRDKLFLKEYTQEISDNLDDLLIKLNKFREIYGKPMIVNSGWRPVSINNKTPGASKKSKHLIGCAADIQDKDGKLGEFCLNNVKILEDCDLYIEQPSFTDGWVHFSSVAPKSGKHVFIP